MNIRCISTEPEAKALNHPREGEEPTPAEIQGELRKYLRLLPDVAEPNLARVREIQEEIQSGTYPTREIIEETAARLAIRFLRKE